MVEESVNADDFFVQLKDQICPALKSMAKKAGTDGITIFFTGYASS